MRVADLYPGEFSSSPSKAVAAAGSLFFAATDPSHGRELWRSDGTAAGTALVKDLRLGAGGSSPRELIVLNGDLYFTADDGTNGVELWKSDGTAAGTVMLKDINPGAGDAVNTYNGDDAHLTAIGNQVFFVANDGVHGPELWKSDGTALGTLMVKDVNPGSAGSQLTRITQVGGQMLFVATDGVHGEELWRSDGTAEGTSMVKDILPGIDDGVGSYQNSLTTVDQRVFFSANDGVHGNELWTSDGTVAGTALVLDVNPGSPSSNPSRKVEVGGTLMFSASDSAHGVELWRSDGSAGGTQIVKDIVPGSGNGFSPFDAEFANVNGTMYFGVSAGSETGGLWKSDGTSAGTTLVKSLQTNTGYTDVSTLRDVGGRLFFVSSAAPYGYELWTSDGTSSGTVLVADIAPGTESSYASIPTDVGGKLLFSADDGTSGTELWKVVTAELPPDSTAPDTVITMGPEDGSTLATPDVTFAFAGTAGDTARLQCSLDGGAFVDCESPKTFYALAAGTHAVAFRAIDAVGNVDPTPVQRSFTVQPPSPTSPSPTVDASPAVAPVNAFTLPTRGVANVKKGTLTLKLALPGPGKLTLTQVRGKDLQKQSKIVTGAGDTALVLRLTKAALSRLRATLNRGAAIARLKVTAKVTFVPVGGTANVEKRAYVLKLK